MSKIFELLKSLWVYLKGPQVAKAKPKKKPKPKADPTPWLTQARKDRTRVNEIKGKAAHPRIQAMFAAVGHPEITSDEISWCAAAQGTWLKEQGYPIPPVSRNLTGISYETYGTGLDEPQIGCICTSHYTKPGDEGHAWKRHVGTVTKIEAARLRVLGGNQRNEVNEKWIERSRMTSYRWPVKADAKSLLKAGSTEIRAARNIKEAGMMTGVLSLSGASVAEYFNGFPSLPDLSLNDVSGSLSQFQTLMGAANVVVKMAINNPWLAAALILLIVAYLIGRNLENNRVRKAEYGQELSQQLAGSA